MSAETCVVGHPFGVRAAEGLRRPECEGPRSVVLLAPAAETDRIAAANQGFGRVTYPTVRTWGAPVAPLARAWEGPRELGGADEVCMPVGAAAAPITPQRPSEGLSLATAPRGHRDRESLAAPNLVTPVPIGATA